MFNLIATIILSIVTTVGVYNYVPLKYIEYLDFRKHEQLGSTITTIQSTDRISDSRATINTNFTNLNDGKIEVSSSSIAAITTLSNLVTVGALSSGSLASGFTTVTVPLGGTGSTTLSSNQLLLGNGTGIVKTVVGWGSSGQFLQSNGGVSAPTWEISAIDQAATYNWTGIHDFAKATTTNATTTSLQVSGLASTSQMIVGALGVGVSTTTQRNVQIAGAVQITGSTTVAGGLNIKGTEVGGIVFLATPVISVDRSTLTSGTFTDIDISATTTVGDFARFAIINAEIRVTLSTCASGDGAYVRFRINGSGIENNLPRLQIVCSTSGNIANGTGMFIVPLDTSQIFEYDFSLGPLTGTTPTSQRLIINTVGYIK